MDDANPRPPAFAPGDVVVLAGQEQLMTVEDYCPGDVYVVWFAGSEANGWMLHRDVFTEAMLVVYRRRH